LQKQQGRAGAVAGLATWRHGSGRVHGAGCGPGRGGGPPVHGGPGPGRRAAWAGSTVDRPRGAAGRGPRWTARRSEPAAAARHGRGPELAGTAFRRTRERAEGTRGVGTTRRGRGAAHLRETGGAERSSTAELAAADVGGARDSASWRLGF